MLEISDYCGIKSGKRVDKSKIFDVFYGELKTALMIKKAALNLECKFIHTIDTKEISDNEMGHDFFIGEGVQTYIEEKYLLNGVPDVEKIKPFVLSGSRNRQRYYNIGEKLGIAWSIGNSYRKE